MISFNGKLMSVEEMRERFHLSIKHFQESIRTIPDDDDPKNRRARKNAEAQLGATRVRLERLNQMDDARKFKCQKQ